MRFRDVERQVIVVGRGFADQDFEALVREAAVGAAFATHCTDENVSHDLRRSNRARAPSVCAKCAR